MDVEGQFSRAELLFGRRALERLAAARVAVFGIGGVGGYVVEALARSGVGRLDLVDADVVSVSNINRQIIALHSTIGRRKTEVMRERVLDINPMADVQIHDCFFLPENADQFPFGEYDYIVDAVDTVTAKVELVLRAQAAGVPIISCMGTGNKFDPTGFRVADIYKTKVCPLAKVMRHELKKRGVRSLKVVYSEEQPVVCGNVESKETVPSDGMINDMQECILCGNHAVPEYKAGNVEGEDLCAGNPVDTNRKTTSRRSIPGSSAFVPPAAGLILAGEVVRDLISDIE